jgi:hypothetical protein
MAQAYSDPERENDPHALPDLEIFRVTQKEIATGEWGDTAPGWYYWFCFPGCMPDSDASGPYATEEEALAAARG